MAISYRTAQRCEAEAGQTVVIHGGGPIGVGIFYTLRRWGVNVIMVDPSPQRRAALTRLGVKTVLDPRDGEIVSAIKDLTGGRGAPISVDAAGVPVGLSDCARRARPSTVSSSSSRSTPSRCRFIRWSC